MTAAMSYPVRKANWILTYQGINITADISSMVQEIIYSDYLEGAAGEIEIALADEAGLWQGPWYPSQGDQVNLAIGYAGEQLLPCGDFQVDELEAEGPPDVFHLRCLAAYIVPAMRTANYSGYEGQTLLGIAGIIAAKYNMTVVGAPNSIDVGFARVTQAHETDLGFLRRLAREHDYGFTVRGNLLVFYARGALEAQPPVYTIRRTEVLHFDFKNKSHAVYRDARIAYQQPANKQLITQTASASPAPATGDTLKLTRRCENGQQAFLKAQGWLHDANMFQMTATIAMSGMTILAAGNNVVLSGFGANDGTYLIQLARHRLSPHDGALPAGYSTEIGARRVIPASEIQHGV
ncbi:MAG: phage late control D family protein [Candidatus Binataceae bacterium]